jgi:hypothetical protein
MGDSHRYASNSNATPEVPRSVNIITRAAGLAAHTLQSGFAMDFCEDNLGV